MEQSDPKYDVFISYSSKNKNVADAIVSTMENQRIKCWYAPRDVLPGESWAGAIKGAIKQTQIFVLVYTEDSNKSQQVTNEVTLAVKGGKTIIPFRLTDSDMNDTLEYYLSSVHWLDAIEPPLSRNIRTLCEKVRSILMIDGRITEEEVSGSTPSDETDSTIHNDRKGNVPDSVERTGGKGSVGNYVRILIAVLIAAWLGGFLLLRIRGGESNPAETTADFSETEDAGYEDDIVVFEDSALEYAVRRSTGIWGRDITTQDAENQTSLNLSGDLGNENGRIASLKGLEKFTWLEEIDLSNNKITDISELGSLVHLRKLNLEKNRIEDITPLKNLTAVSHLDLNTNEISDIASLQGLTKIHTLDVRNNNIKNIDVVDQMLSMKELYIARNQIEDISPISELVGLTYLSAGYNKIEDINPLINLTELEVINLNGNNIHDISVLARLSKLYYLEIADNPIVDYSPLDDLSEEATVIRD